MRIIAKLYIIYSDNDCSHLHLAIISNNISDNTACRRLESMCSVELINMGIANYENLFSN